MAIEDVLSRISTIGARFGVHTFGGFNAEYTGAPNITRTVPLAGDDAVFGAGDPEAADGGRPDIANLGADQLGLGAGTNLADLAREIADQAGSGDDSGDVIAALLAQQQAALGLGGDR